MTLPARLPPTKVAFYRKTYYGPSSNDRLNWKPMTRPAEYTRHSIIKAAVDLFAQKGFQGASVRDIVAKARVNQAAINYHFKGKDGLYLEVLKTAFEKLTENAGFDAEKLESLLGRSAKLRVPAIAAAAVPRRNEPLHSNVRLGERTSVQGLSQIHSDEFGHLSDGRGRYRAPIPASKHTETGRPVRGHLANGAMQRLRAEPRAVCARAVQYHRR